MQKLILVPLLLFFSTVLLGQSPSEGKLKLSVQTDLLAYTTLGGWSAWGSAQYQRAKLSLAFINYPNRFRSIYDETGIKETDRFARLQLSLNNKPESKLKNFFYGLNAEYHWRELEEDNNPDEILQDTHFQIGAFLGYEWAPWRERASALQNLSFIFWGGLNWIPDNTALDRVFENTGNVYPISSIVRTTIGINVSYTFFKK